jgi:hypothetical protein
VDRQGAAAAQIAAHQTREAKLDVSHEEMQRRHQELADQFGNQPTTVVETTEHRHERHAEHEREQVDAARQAVTFARDRNLEREAVVEERSILRDALQRSLGEARVKMIKRGARSARRSRRIRQRRAGTKHARAVIHHARDNGTRARND